ncbi:CGNR zinc finger domain-containing protein [uncultured Roseobacter sp.]|uniref:CGNR zinc finger domain-containing protein n=1 Tax=uncultured Roseobacter sp. TaxID=114847 RepID=UPI00261DEE3B|nr:CGNR zinc finger domain-containing protein [uncultured Roseobacter sp.]
MTAVRPDPFLVGDSPALDFLNSVAAPRSVEIEWLGTGADVLDWLVQSGLLTDEEISVLRDPRHGAALDRATKDIQAFREEFRSFVGTMSTANKVQDDHPMIGQLNRLMSRGALTLQLAQSETEGFDCKIKHRIQTADDLLPRIAAACAELISEADFTHVKRCEGSGCTLFFRDMSKNHKRRWCSMEVCGNRAKVAAHRKRS